VVGGWVASFRDVDAHHNPTSEESACEWGQPMPKDRLRAMALLAHNRMRRNVRSWRKLTYHDARSWPVITVSVFPLHLFIRAR
jgi:hypothetical protein